VRAGLLRFKVAKINVSGVSTSSYDSGIGFSIKRAAHLCVIVCVCSAFLPKTCIPMLGYPSVLLSSQSVDHVEPYPQSAQNFTPQQSSAFMRHSVIFISYAKIV
jgi:hypothetical protein